MRDPATRLPIITEAGPTSVGLILGFGKLVTHLYIKGILQFFNATSNLKAAQALGYFFKFHMSVCLPILSYASSFITPHGSIYLLLMYLPIYQVNHLSFCPSFFLSFFTYLSLSLSAQFMLQALHLLIYIFIHQPIHVYVYIYPSLPPSIIHPSIYLRMRAHEYISRMQCSINEPLFCLWQVDSSKRSLKWKKNRSKINQCYKDYGLHKTYFYKHHCGRLQ